MTNFGTMRYKHIISVVLWSMFLVACGPDRRVALAEKLMAEKETDSAIAVMQEMKFWEPIYMRSIVPKTANYSVL